MIVILAGLPGTGKTTLARALAAETGGAVLNKDEVRAALFTPELIEYSPEQDDVVQEALLLAGGYLLERHPGRPVFLDGRTFSRSYQIENAIQAAETIPSSWRVIECVCAEETARARLARDSAVGVHPARNRDFGLYLSVKAYFEPVTRPKLVVDTDQPLAAGVEAALRHLSRP